MALDPSPPQREWGEIFIAVLATAGKT